MDSSPKIFIVGHNTLLNQLFGAVVGNELREPFEISPRVEAIEDAATRPDRTLHLIVADESDESARSGLFHLLAETNKTGRAQVVTAFFNVEQSARDLGQAVRNGVKGLFFARDRVEKVIQGVRKLLSGESWIPDELQPGSHLKRSEVVATRMGPLTHREIEVIALVSEGATNDQIAASLSISPHTVKTHLYNVYQKLGISGRFHAALWAREHLGDRLSAFLPDDAGRAPLVGARS